MVHDQVILQTTLPYSNFGPAKNTFLHFAKFFGERDVQIFHLEKKVNMHRSLPPYYKGKLNFLKHCALSKQQSNNFTFKKQKHMKRQVLMV